MVMLQDISEVYQEVFQNLPDGWRSGVPGKEPPYVHKDGRISYRNPVPKEEALKKVVEGIKNFREFLSMVDPEDERLEELDRHLDIAENGLTHLKNHSTKKVKSNMTKRRNLDKYKKMKKMGVPRAAIEQRAFVDGVDLKNVDLDDISSPLSDGREPPKDEKATSLMETGSANTFRVQKGENGTPQVESSADLTKKSNMNKFKNWDKYKKMEKMGVPRPAIEQSALIDGVDLKNIDLDDMSSHALEEKDSSKSERNTSHSEIYSIKTFCVRKGKDGTPQVEFSADLTKNTSSTYLPTLVRKIVQTIKCRTKLSSRGSYLAVSMLDLYNSLGTLRAVQRAIEECNSTLGDSAVDAFRAENKEFFLYKRKAFAEYSYMVGTRPPWETGELAAIEGLDELVTTVENHYSKDIEEFQRIFARGKYTHNSLTELYRPGNHVLAKGVFCSGVDMMCKVKWSRFEEGKTITARNTRYFRVCFQFVAAVGDHFTICQFTEGMDKFDSERDLRDLSFIPMDFISVNLHEEHAVKNIKDSLYNRGKLYSKYAIGTHFVAYSKGSFFAKYNTKSSKSVAASRVGGRAMMDTKGAYEAGQTISVGYDPMVEDIKNCFSKYLHLRRQTQKGTATALADNDLILFKELPEDLYVLTWPACIGFSFKSKICGDTLVDGISEIAFQEESFNSLVLPPATKRIVKALVRHSAETFSDIVAGKGEGSVFLLYGPPGVGKTLTAEAISEILHRPLYSVSLGQLGTTPTELETTLQEVLDLCSKWDALVLLDEADMFLEKRSASGSIQRNAMVSIMLKQMEYFKGTLFLTSNRVKIMDPAFKTRITLALQYDSLDVSAREKVWRNLLQASGNASCIKDECIDVSELAKYNLNGREIKNAIRLAMALTKEDNKEGLSREAIMETISILLSFNEKLDLAENY